MECAYKIINGTKEEENIIHSIISFILNEYPEKIDISKLKIIEVVDKLDNDSSGRSIRDKIILPRKYGLENIQLEGSVSKDKLIDSKLNMLVSTIYHELWHISTWDKYEMMYEYVLDEENSDVCTAFAYMYWIEYVAHVETIFMEDTDIMNEFCENFVRKKWHKIEYGYSYFIKALPYYLVRSNYLELFDELTKEIVCNELKNAAYEFNKMSKILIQRNDMQEMDKANVIKNMIEKLFE